MLIAAVTSVETTAKREASVVPGRLAVAVSLLAVIIAVGIGRWAFMYGAQPIFGDAQGYYDLGLLIATGGLSGFVSEVRTYGYPAFLALVMVGIGNEPDRVQLGVFVAQLAIFIGACWLAARRLGHVVGATWSAPAVFVATVVNPFLLISTVQLLTDFLGAVLVYLAVVLSLPRRDSEPTSRVTMLAIVAFLCAGFAVMVRPSNLVVAPVLVAIWLARGFLFRDVSWRAVPLIALAFALPFVPQALANHRAFGVAHPLLVKDLYSAQGAWGLQYAKYGTLAMTGIPARLIYENPFRPDIEIGLGRIVLEQPGAYVATLAVHAFGLIDQDYPFTYIREIDPWYRWPLSVGNYLFFLGTFVGVVVAIRAARGPNVVVRLRQQFAMLALVGVSAAIVALYLPTAVENRFSLVLYPLLTPAFVTATIWIGRAVLRADVLVLVGSVLVGTIWVSGGVMASTRLQEQAPLLVKIRSSQMDPPPVTPLAAYTTRQPAEVRVEEERELDVTVTNIGEDTWNRSGFYPVEVAVRFIATKADLHQKVKGKMKDSQAVPLPSEVAPGETVTVRLRYITPPEPGRYTMLIHVTRVGAPDSDTVSKRTVTVAREQ